MFEKSNFLFSVKRRWFLLGFLSEGTLKARILALYAVVLPCSHGKISRFLHQHKQHWSNACSVLTSICERPDTKVYKFIFSFAPCSLNEPKRATEESCLSTIASPLCRFIAELPRLPRVFYGGSFFSQIRRFLVSILVAGLRIWFRVIPNNSFLLDTSWVWNISWESFADIIFGCERLAGTRNLRWPGHFTRKAKCRHPNSRPLFELY